VLPHRTGPTSGEPAPGLSPGRLPRRVVPRPTAVIRRNGPPRTDPAGVLPLPSAPLAALAVVLALLPPTAASPPGPVPVPPSGATPRSTSPTTWVDPLDGPVVVVGRFDPPELPWLAGHRGVDLAADPGDLVRAVGAGTVTWAAPVAGLGVVVVQHPDGRRTTYEPVDPEVAVGDELDAGDPVGVLVPGTGHCGGVPACLHWGLLRDDDYLDPMLLLRSGRPVLLP
jgi:murein DD-endopeptidase MepM/ murein hydrolase activator NlpD